MNRTYQGKIWSVDGGGIRGIIPTIILGKIEKETEKYIFEMFDLIAGTSTGGILALDLTKLKSILVQELVKLYKDKGGYIFHQ